MSIGIIKNKNEVCEGNIKTKAKAVNIKTFEIRVMIFAGNDHGTSFIIGEATYFRKYGVMIEKSFT